MATVDGKTLTICYWTEESACDLIVIPAVCCPSVATLSSPVLRLPLRRGYFSAAKDTNSPLIKKSGLKWSLSSNLLTGKVQACVGVEQLINHLLGAPSSAMTIGQSPNLQEHCLRSPIHHPLSGYLHGPEDDPLRKSNPIISSSAGLLLKIRGGGVGGKGKTGRRRRSAHLRPGACPEEIWRRRLHAAACRLERSS